MPFIIQFIVTAIFGAIGYLAGGMITIRIGDEPFNTSVLLLMVGALIGYFVGRGVLPLFEHSDDHHHTHAKNGSK